MERKENKHAIQWSLNYMYLKMEICVLCLSLLVYYYYYV